MEKQVELPDFYFNFHVASLRFLGIEVLIKNESIMYRIYSFFVLLFTGTFVFVECIELIFHSDFDSIVVCCNYAISHFLGMIKVVVLYTNRKKIGDLLMSLHQGVYKPNEQRGGTTERQIIRDTLDKTTFLMICYMLSILIVYSLGLTSGMKSRLTQPQEMWKLSFEPISLWNSTYTPNFEITYVYQALGIFMITLCVYSNDVTVISIIAQVGAQLKILENCVRNYEERGKRYQTINKIVNVEQALNLTLQECVDYHLSILDTVTTVESLCCYLALCVFMANLVLLCLLMYYTSLMPLQSLEFVQYFVYCLLIAIQVFLYCWWGNEMTLANESLALSTAQTYSPYQPVSHAKALKLMMIRAQKPLFFTAVFQKIPATPHTAWNTKIIKNEEVLFYLYTRENPAQPIQIFSDNLHRVNTSKSTKLIVHGFFENAGRSWYKNMTNEYLRNADYNIIQVDWSGPASVSYTAAAWNTRDVGSIVGALIVNLHSNYGLSLDNVHIIGHSLGAHVAGYAGKEVHRRTGLLVDRITALDAAGPLFEGSLINLEGLSKTDADIVDAIHTDGGVFGRAMNTGTVDFYPNGGTGPQPGCSPDDVRIPPRNYVELMSEVFCSHTRSYHFFISSINEEQFVALKCNSWNEYERRDCKGNVTALMGDGYVHTFPEAAGSYYLVTNSQSPFSIPLKSVPCGN